MIPIHYLVLGWLAGSPCDNEVDLSADQLRNLGGIFGRLHSIRVEEWETKDGRPPFRNEDPSFSEATWREYLLKVGNLHPDCDPDANVVTQWLNARSPQSKSECFKSLTHGDPHGNNVVVNGGELFLIDTDQMCFSYAPFELCRCLLANYTKFDSTRQKAFLSGYRESASEQVYAMWERNALFYFAVVFLYLSYQRILRAESVQDISSRKRAYSSARECFVTFHHLTTAAEQSISTCDEIMLLYNDVRQEAC